jgi:hypothetical protein
VSADRGKVYENAFTAVDLMRARGATEKEIQAFRKRQTERMMRPKKRTKASNGG